MALFVFVSVLTVKQHVIADVIGAVVFAEFSYWITGFDRGPVKVIQKERIKKFPEIKNRSKA
jgi:hypothetical protein